MFAERSGSERSSQIKVIKAIKARKMGQHYWKPAAEGRCTSRVPERKKCSCRFKCLSPLKSLFKVSSFLKPGLDTTEEAPGGVPSRRSPPPDPKACVVQRRICFRWAMFWM